MLSPKKEATPKSFIVSIRANANPAIIPGADMGIPILRKHSYGDLPIVLPASIYLADRLIMEILVKR